MENCCQQRREALYGTLLQVPMGKVVTYGQLAQLAGLGRAARWVGSQLKRLPDDTQLPWHRVVNHSGAISVPEGSDAWSEQIRRLAAEGISVVNRRVSMRQHQWRPEEDIQRQ